MEFLESMQEYFRGEKIESAAILAGAGLLIVAAGVLYFGLRDPFARGLAGVLVVTALLGAAVGGTILLRTDRQVTQLASLYETDPARFAATEGPRITAVVRSFRTYRAAYLLAATSALLLLVLASRPLHHGIAVGLLLFAALGFTVDHFAEERAMRYAERVEGVEKAAAVGAARSIVTNGPSSSFPGVPP